MRKKPLEPPPALPPLTRERQMEELRYRIARWVVEQEDLDKLAALARILAR
jgi:hypothetical protein